MEKNFLKKCYPFLPALISGILLVLSFPRFDLFGLAWISFVPLLFSLWKKDWRDSFVSGFIFGMAYFFGTLYWVYHSINHFGGVPFFASIIIVLFLSAYLSLFPAFFSLLFSQVYRKTRLPALFIAPVLWVCMEYIRSYALTGFPWASVGYSQYRFLSLIQISDITGIYGISFLVLAVNGLFSDLLLIRKRLKEMPLFPLSYFVSGVVVLVMVMIAAFGYGFWRLHQDRIGRDLTVSVIQGNIEQDKKWEPIFQNEVIDIYTKLSREALKEHPSLLVWPETAVPFLFGSDIANTEQLVEFQRQINTYLLFGAVMVKKQAAGSSELANSAILLDKNGKKSYVYDKIHLVPFGEYVPLRNVFFFIDKLVVGIGDYIPGRQYLQADTEMGRFSTLICYEVIFPGLVRKFYTGGGDFMVTITNDAWFGSTAGPYQHFTMAVFRAIENRKPLIRAANTGISGFIDSNGKILAQSGLFDRQVLTKTVKTDSAMTFYTRFGDLFSFFCIVISIILLGNLVSRR
ncbi:MAG: apolipoprotein N-acyltransferase [Nitrospirae bacterium]|nr:apolipoprotein N-acyltransferase [Nitrospirota bacterium]